METTPQQRSEKRKRIVYWIFTIWMAFGMAATGAFQFIKNPDQVAMFQHLGYPDYFLSMLGICKFLGVIAVLIPGFPILKEWAYAGFVFTMLGAGISHLCLGDAIGDVVPPFFLLSIILISYFTRPADRRPATAIN